MFVCICNAVSDKAIRQAVADGARSFDALQHATGCATCCGCCEPLARKLFAEAVAGQSRRLPLTVMPLAHAA